MSADDPGGGWQRLDPRMLLVYPVKELLRFLPVLVGLVVAGTATGSADPWWQVLGVVVPVVLGVLRYVTTSYRVAHGRIELRRGLVDRHTLSAPLDRVRTVDVVAPAVHRLLGLTVVRIGTGTASTEDEDQVDLDGLGRDQARRLRSALLPAGGAERGAAEPTRPPVLRLDPAWARFAPLTGSGLVVVAGGLGALVQALGTTGELRLDVRDLGGAVGWSAWVAVPLGLVGLALVVSLLSVAGYLVGSWGLELTRTGTRTGGTGRAGGAWHLRRGLLTTRETTLADERVRGVCVAEPLGLRLVGAAWLSVIATGLGGPRSGDSVLVPPAPRPTVDRVAAAVLGTPLPTVTPLVGHGPRARTRRYTRAVVPVVGALAVAVLLAVLGRAPWWVPSVVALGVPAAVTLAHDRAVSLGHALVDGHLVVRSGSLRRRREALAVDGIIGWNLRSTWFQRRAGLATLVATTAGGRQAVVAPDLPETEAVRLAWAATPGLVGPLLEARPAPGQGGREARQATVRTPSAGPPVVP